jgi:hypothetical protein
MKARYQDLLYTNDDIRPLLSADNKILVPVHPVNEDIVNFDFYGSGYGIFVLNPECRNLGTLLGRIAVIHPVSKRESKEGMYAMEGNED